MAAADDNRIALAAYLKNAGFEVHPCDELSVPGSFGALVWCADKVDDSELVARVRSWLRPAKHPRIVVVTSRPAALRDLAVVHAERLSVLAAPVFGWELVEALRAPPAPTPRGA